MVRESKQKIISEFCLPEELKDDIAYCQRSLRDCVKVHQHFAQQCKGLSGAQQVQVKGFLRELEDEMLAIGKDQRRLVQDITTRLKHFQRKAASERSVELDDDLANGYVAWILSTHCELQSAPAYVPFAVSERMNETQLYQKYRLDAGRNNALVREKLPRKRPVLQTSLLKPLAERLPDAGVQQQPKPSLTPPSTPIPLPLPPPAVMKVPPSTTGNKRKVPPEQPPMPVKVLRSRTTSTVLVKPDPTPVKHEPMEQQGQEPGNDSEESSPTAASGMPESPAVKRGRCNLRQALSKVKCTQKISPPASTGKSTAGRSNRPAGGSLPCTPATGQRSPSLSSSESSNSRASTPGTSSNALVVAAAAAAAVRKQEVTSDDSSNERFLPLPEELPPQPCSIAELDQYGFLKHFGLYTIADSDLLKGRKSERKRRSCYSTERKDFHYGRLDYFEQQLYIMRRQGSNKRVRLLYSAATAEKANKKRKPWPNGVTAPPPVPPPPLLPPSPTVPTTTVIATTPPRSEPSDAATVDNALMGEENKVCFVCNQIGSTDILSACTECCNTYHPSCHVDEDKSDGTKDDKADSNPPSSDQDLDDNERQAGDDDRGDENQNHPAVELLPQRDNLCPICFALAKGSMHKK
uniref:PHD-type domain-containing protein n=1 Tax=Anopheles atroparvus TaxID=41427 RepID=A0AAG5DJ31_ANOAO